MQGHFESEYCEFNFQTYFKIIRQMKKKHTKSSCLLYVKGLLKPVHKMCENEHRKERWEW